MGPIVRMTPEDLLGTLNDVERKHAPPALFVVGDPRHFSAGSRVAVVGTRKPSADGVRRAQVLTQRLVEHGMIAVSGLAEGIDTVVHTTALDAGGRTVAVVGNGPDKFFPTSNRGLQERIAQEHVLVSQFPPGTPPTRGTFPQRNRTMALLCDATIIVEAGESSGTLHQGWEALRLGRPLFLFESLTKRADLTWPAQMIEYGAQVLSKENLETVLEAMPMRVRGELAF